MTNGRSSPAVASTSSTGAWSVHDASELYEVARWGHGYFSVNGDGHVAVHPTKDPARVIDLKELVDRLQLRGISLPVLIRFTDILRHRLGEIHAAFQGAIAQNQYHGGYSCVYPVKVNQQRQVVEEVLDFGRPYGFGLEAGSKPELLAVVALADNETPIICNGFKDAEFIETAMLGLKIGRNIIPVVEKYTELALILEAAEKIGVRPQIGVRVKLAARGSGRWQSSGGFRSKFGLTVTEIIRALEELRACGMQDCLTLLHFHLGSQITNIRIVKGALNEAARLYAELSRLGAGLQYLDVGGGLGVDYDGSQTNFESSMNYTLEEYANDVVYHIQTVCDETGVPHPTIISESGRAVVAYHSVLVFNVLGVSGFGAEQVPATANPDWEQPLVDLVEAYNNVTARNALEAFHDAQQSLDMAISLFNGGYLPLEQRSMAENLFWAICTRLQKIVQTMAEVPEDLQNLDEQLSDTYFCNFSLFQSIPDSWAIKQLFPVMPIHRLGEKPANHAVLGDITCDSDGKLDRFVDRRDVKKTLPLHTVNGGPYYLGVFLVGAYQEILGDLHNLFGDTHAVHVSLDPNGEVRLDTLIKGDTVREVLDYVEFDAEILLGKLRTDVETAVRAGRIDYEGAGRLLRFYEDGLHGYTYLEG
ncbi:MAG: arginine decarboxylase [Acidobacteria bacterium RIFCSPLOWO2_02_FULL_68_18]|nr:MAG: arginine decarboxylase [Acidobacteria bacterium RIFCSPLOWO2_02_FULL_68_18]OFW48120.1 MAG: arginine decarboxylase [Acidobacteria bacterium RIFCSPLOWO2_12_FULL_68_19]